MTKSAIQGALLSLNEAKMELDNIISDLEYLEALEPAARSSEDLTSILETMTLTNRFMTAAKRKLT